MDAINAIAASHGLMVIEDAAQGVMSKYKGRPLGAIGHMGTLSFHETKNVISGEGGALLINDAAFASRAEIIREKGTNRSQFFRGQVDKYTWVDIGSSYLPSELIAAFLWAQMEEAEHLTERRLSAWNQYHELLQPLETEGLLRRPIIPAHCEHNAHMYYVLLDSLDTRSRVIRGLREAAIHSVFHYVPLHSAPAGLQYGRVSGSMTHTDSVAHRLLRLPLWIGIETEIPNISEQLKRLLRRSPVRACRKDVRA